MRVKCPDEQSQSFRHFFIFFCLLLSHIIIIMSSFVNIQRDQERESSGNGYYNNNNHHQRDSARGRGRGANNGGGGGSRHSSNDYRNNNDRGDLPLEQGVICSLKESFGFIYCADRPEEVFFHYSEYNGGSINELECDTEVEFRIGMAQRKDKLNAYQVRKLEPGTIVWQEEEEPDKIYRGLVDRPTRFERGQTTDGTIRTLVEKRDGDLVIDSPDGPEVLFRQNDYQPTNEDQNNQQANASTNFGRRSPPRLLKGDLVEFSVVFERRTKERFAKNIRLVLSEKQRVRQEQEKKMLAEATEEVGVVTSLKGEYGFLLSNRRREEVYFHYSAIDMEASEHGPDSDDLVLKEGQEMKFLVVNEGGDGESGSHGKRRLSARRVSLEPKGSVKFHDAVACGVTGTVVLCPQPADEGHSLEAKGKIRLDQPITYKAKDGSERYIDEVYLSTRHSPGGTYFFHGGSASATWIQLGDTLLFDIVSDYVDGACHAAPTKHSVSNPTPFAIEEEGDPEHPIVRRIRLLSLSLMARSEGIVNNVKEAYGFIHFAERPVDVHFKLYQVLPDELQNDLRQHMGLSNCDDRGRPLRLNVGAEVMFDISVHGKIHGATPVKSRKQLYERERENLKAQRVLFLPPGTIQQTKTLGIKVRGKISKLDSKQLYSGNVELDNEVMPMSAEERHPLVSQMIEYLLTSPVAQPLVYHDILSAKEEDVIKKMIETKAGGLLDISYIPVPSEADYPGKLCLRKVTPTEVIAQNTDDNANDLVEDVASCDEDANESMSDTQGTAQRRKKKEPNSIHPLASVRFDKSSLSEDLKQDAPVAVNDVVEFDVLQLRRTGMVVLTNMRIIERLTPAVYQVDDKARGMGVVKEVVATRNFGFIAVWDESSTKRESLFFQLSTDAGASKEKTNTSMIQKGDEVAFSIVTQRSGKRVAQDISILPKGTVPSHADKNACRGIVLLEPSSTTIKPPPMRLMKSVHSAAIDKSSRWASGIDEAKQSQRVETAVPANGCILLLEDPANMFAGKPIPSKSSSTASNGSLSDNNESPVTSEQHNVESETVSDESPTCSILSHVTYRNGAIAIHGIGSTDEASGPRRGDLVSFVKAKGGSRGVRDIRIVTPSVATFIRGHVEDINRVGEGTIKFVGATEEGAAAVAYEVTLEQVVGCDASALKENESVEGILHDGKIYGLCRTSDLYLDSKFGLNNKERPKLNLTVKKDRGGKIMAQSHMAKGPDGTLGFALGWTSRASQHGRDEECNEPTSNVDEISP